MKACPRVYLAGPDLFYPDADERYGRLRAICAGHGLDAVAPTDGQAFPIDTTSDCSRRLYRHNIAALRSCDAVLGNIAPFQGLDADSGTAYELGVAAALGMPVATYCPDGLTVRERIERSGRRIDAAGRDDTGLLVEDFGLTANLMLCAEHPYFLAPADAAEHLAATLAEFSHAADLRARSDETIADLSMLVSRLAKRLRDGKSPSPLADAAIDYLRRKRLLAKPFREQT